MTQYKEFPELRKFSNDQLRTAHIGLFDESGRGYPKAVRNDLKLRRIWWHSVNQEAKRRGGWKKVLDM